MSTEEVLLRKGRMIVGVDGSPSSISALEWAAKYAEELDSSIEVIATWERYIPPGDLIASGMPLGSLMPEIPPEESAEEILRDCTQRVFKNARPLDLKTRAIEGDPAHVLIAESSTATMLVLGSRGHGQLYNLVLGSVSASCAAKAHCPVLIVHHRE
jgi:nucleotide-binding universal stress UspA family protein